MKKKYILPQTIIVALNVETLLIGTSETKINEGNKGDFDYTKKSGDWGNLWDDTDNADE